MKVSFITTINTNVGDDFIREGIQYLLGQYYPRFESYFINKHNLKTLGEAQSGEGKPVRDKILDADLIVQAGTPLYWRNTSSSCATAPWIKPLWYDRIAQVYEKQPVLNLGAGSSQYFHSNGSEILEDGQCREFIRDSHRMCRLTIVRDRLASRILTELGLTHTSLPCPSIFVSDNFKTSRTRPEIVAVNYMHKAGHFDYRDEVDAAHWRDVFFRTIAQVKKTQKKVVFVCHSIDEYALAKSLFPGEKLFYSSRYEDYLTFYSRCKFGIFNRIHSTFALASFGFPSILIGSDTRTSMAELIGTPFYCATEVSSTLLVDKFHELNRILPRETERIRAVKNQALDKYSNLLQDALQIGPSKGGAIGKRRPAGARKKLPANGIGSSASLEVAVQTLSEKYESLVSEDRSLGDMLKARDRRLVEMDDEIRRVNQQWRHEVGELHQRFGEQERDRGDRLVKLQAAEATIRELNLKLQEQAEKLANLDTELRRINLQFQEREAEFHRRFAEQEKDRNERLVRLQAAEATIRELNAKLQQRDARLVELDGDLRDRNEQFHQKEAGFHDRFAEQEKDRTERLERLQKAEQLIQELNEGIRRRDQRLGELDAELRKINELLRAGGGERK